MTSTSAAIVFDGFPGRGPARTSKGPMSSFGVPASLTMKEVAGLLLPGMLGRRRVFTLIPEVLTVEELRAIGVGLAAARYVAGATTAGGAAREVKANQQAAMDTRAYEQAATVVRNAFLRNDKLQATLLPASVTRVIFNRYAQGMQYGPHIDSPLMGQMGNL